MKKLLLLLPLAAMTACSDPRSDCIAKASRDLSVVRALIADTKATIDRGYAVQTETRNVIYTDFCIGAGRNHGVFTFCNRVQPVTTRKAVAVDLAAEQRKLRSLTRKEGELRRRTASDIQRCELAFPEA
jgi:hypothetical protein